MLTLFTHALNASKDLDKWDAPSYWTSPDEAYRDGQARREERGKRIRRILSETRMYP